MSSSSGLSRPWRLAGAISATVVIALASIDARLARSQGVSAPVATPTDDAGAEADPADPAAVDPDLVVLGDGGAPIDAPPPPPNADRDALDAWLARRLDALLAERPELATARVGAVVADAGTGATLWAHDADGRYNLASNTKVLTAAAALARLGPDFHWRTSVHAERFDPRNGLVDGDLYVRGRGDPTLTSAHLRTLVDDLRLAGVTRIRGGLVIDDSYFDGATEPPRFADQPKERAGFRAPIGAVSVDNNTITVVIEPDPSGSGAARIRLEPPAGDYVVLTHAAVLTISTGRSRVSVQTTLKRDHLEIAVVGQLRADEGVTRIRRRVDDPVRLAGEALRAYLAQAGIRVGNRKLRRGVVPRTARVLAFRDSVPLGDVVREMNKTSNNFYAELLLKTLGAESRVLPGPATWADGQAEVRRWLTEAAGLVEGSFRVENGSGLFGASDLAPMQVVGALLAAHRDYRVGPDLATSLAIVGVDGTLRRRLMMSPARGRVRAKTGTLATVSTLAGYAAIDGRHPLAFAILVNDIPEGKRGWARLLQDQMLEALIAYLDEREP